MDDKNLTKAKYSEWQASLFGACFVAFALGVLLAGFMRPFAMWILVVGIAIHSWGMYKIHQRNK
jgi:hypothetical protein